MARGFGSWDLTRGHGRRLYQVVTALISAMGLFILTTTVWSSASAAAATHFSVSAPATATAGSAFSITVTALDGSNAADTTYAGTVHFTSSDGAAILPTDATLTNGIGAFSVTLNTTGTQTITATDTVASSITGTSGAITVSGNADLALTKSVSNATPNVGDTVTFTVTLSNNGPDTATNVTVTDLLPAGLTFVSATPSQGTYVSLSGLWSIGTVTTVTPATLQIQATVATPNPATNTATVSGSDEFDANPANNSASATVTPQQAELALTKTVNNPTPNVGDTVTFTVTLSNNGPDTATNVTVTDLLPAGLTFVSATPSQGTYVSLSGLWTIGTVTTLTPATLQIQATVATPTPATNTATVSHSDQFDANPANNSASATLIPVPGNADLALTKTVNNTTPNVGDTVTFTVTLSNNGPDTATNVTVTDLLPAGLTFVSATPSQGTYLSLTGVWTVGTVTTVTPATLQIQATVATPTSATNTATVSGSDQVDANPANNSASATVTPQQADLALTKTVNNATPAVGNTVTFTVTIANNGPDTATNVTVNDLLPAGLAFVSATPSQGTYSSVTGVWTIGTLTTGTPQTLQLQATVNSSSPITNTATVSHADQFDSQPANNSASVTLNAGPTATSTSLTASPSPGVAGQPVTFTATVVPVPPSGTPTGTVTFFDGATTLGTIALPSPAVLTTSALSVGTHQITATYSGSTSFAPSTSAILVVTVAAAPATTTTTVPPISTVPTTPAQPPTGTLPHTGGNSDRTGAFAMLALMVGAALTTLARRRHS